VKEDQSDFASALPQTFLGIEWSPDMSFAITFVLGNCSKMIFTNTVIGMAMIKSVNALTRSNPFGEKRGEVIKDGRVGGFEI